MLDTTPRGEGLTSHSAKSRLSRAHSKEKTSRTNNLPTISVIICTKDRPVDLAELLQTLLKQTYPPLEVIVVDDSPSSTVKEVVNSFQQRFYGVELRYVEGCGEGLPAARNLGVKVSGGDAILFLDDDTLLQSNVLHAFATFLATHQNAIGVQGYIPFSIRGIENAINKALMVTYYRQNKLAVRRSGANVFPYSYPLTEEINAQRLSGCCMCYRRELFNELNFDKNLKQWGFMEDFDFSYRVFKKSPESLFAIPHAVIVHKGSTHSRLPSKTRVRMMITYWFYVFFKDIFESSILNLIAFLWALTGNLITITGGLIVKRKPKHVWWEFVYLVNSYFYAFRHLREIKRRNLDFFNNQLKDKSPLNSRAEFLRCSGGV